MTGSDGDLGLRLYGMMQHVLGAYAQHVDLSVPEPRGVVEHQDALNAVVHLAGAVDRAGQSGHIDKEQAEWMASLLMVIHDYMQPLPPGIGEDADGGTSDHLTADLQEIVSALRQGRAESGLHG
jgi:hypothetical protein